jgi:hypothetical protein
LREEAERDLALTLEDESGAGEAWTLIDPDGNEFGVAGVTGDIGILYSAETGETLRNRSVRCACRASSLAKQTALVPERGWRARVTGVGGVPMELFVAGCDTDRTLGVHHLTMALAPEETETAEAGE